ncbi:MAG: plasmid pRiA4b ORF-3 family protein [Chlorobi bacterium]|nr:plasmid pRiA4b ORF-3 family protein [Chlorobiota bacterium]
MKRKKIFQFKISLIGTNPLIWRRIQVPSNYSFWDLHVAIQDSMGWIDYHLHNFEMKDPSTNQKTEIGIPYEEDAMWGGRKILPDHKTKISKYFNEHNKKAIYEYDFGDSWRHNIHLEKILEANPNEIYPQCVAGKMACPPEDCGGIGGYYNLIEILSDSSNEEYEEMIEWLGEKYDYEQFDPKDVVFDDPKERFDFMNDE